MTLFDWAASGFLPKPCNVLRLMNRFPTPKHSSPPHSTPISAFVSGSVAYEHASLNYYLTNHDFLLPLEYSPNDVSLRTSCTLQRIFQHDSSVHHSLHGSAAVRSSRTTFCGSLHYTTPRRPICTATSGKPHISYRAIRARRKPVQSDAASGKGKQDCQSAKGERCWRCGTGSAARRDG